MWGVKFRIARRSGVRSSMSPSGSTSCPSSRKPATTSNSVLYSTNSASGLPVKLSGGTRSACISTSTRFLRRPTISHDVPFAPPVHVVHAMHCQHGGEVHHQIVLLAVRHEAELLASPDHLVENLVERELILAGPLGDHVPNLAAVPP